MTLPSVPATSQDDAVAQTVILLCSFGGACLLGFAYVLYQYFLERRKAVLSIIKDSDLESTGGSSWNSRQGRLFWKDDSMNSSKQTPKPTAKRSNDLDEVIVVAGEKKESKHERRNDEVTDKQQVLQFSGDAVMANVSAISLPPSTISPEAGESTVSKPVPAVKRIDLAFLAKATERRSASTASAQTHATTIPPSAAITNSASITQNLNPLIPGTIPLPPQKLQIITSSDAGYSPEDVLIPRDTTRKSSTPTRAMSAREKHLQRQKNQAQGRCAVVGSPLKNVAMELLD
ncbi:hypothetical protein BDR26DRAFT_850092 [Obelidium mucronatum]|nr:hypothetical protein BDR26DRAFT_850092 [Obelidium mucronatum]